MSKKLTDEEVEEIHDLVNNEGFDYCFTNYTDFAHVKNKKFHKLRLEFLDAREALAELLRTYGVEC